MTGAPASRSGCSAEPEPISVVSADTASIPSAWPRGPWKAFYKHKYDEWHVAMPYGEGSFLCPLASDGISTPDPAQREAVANLIAAAPDLYEGCNALLGLIQLILGRDDLTPDLRVALGNSHRLIEAKAALAKARGEQQ